LISRKILFGGGILLKEKSHGIIIRREDTEARTRIIFWYDQEKAFMLQCLAS
jgi:hypothetical protein